MAIDLKGKFLKISRIPLINNINDLHKRYDINSKHKETGKVLGLKC
jgi:hypothetical protein